MGFILDAIINALTKLVVKLLGEKVEIKIKNYFKKPVLKVDDNFLTYDTSKTISYYHNIPDILKDNDNQIYAPYQIIHRFSVVEIENGWADVEFVDDFEFPHLLLKHKKQIVELFDKQNKLSKGNLSATRIVDFVVDNNFPKVKAQTAKYYDQVGTNLSLDFELIDKIDGCNNLRDWDLKQSGTESGNIPPLVKSKLANTLGVAIGITAKDSKKEEVLLIRLRTNKTAVYSKMWHLPFSFAHCPDKTVNKKPTKLKDYIINDFQSELMEELGLSISDFYEPIPLALCRDLVRGGKPQLFLIMSSKLGFEELKKRIKNKSIEYKKSIKKNVSNANNYSPELRAFELLLKMKNSELG